MTEDLVMMIVAGTLAVTAMISVAAVHMRRQTLLETGLRERERTIQLLAERFGSAPEFIAFAASPEAALLFSTIDAPAMLARRVSALLTGAILLVAIGIGFWFNAMAVSGDPDINFIRRAADERWWATLCLAAGIGMGVAAAISGRMARQWGLIGR